MVEIEKKVTVFHAAKYIAAADSYSESIKNLQLCFSIML